MKKIHIILLICLNLMGISNTKGQGWQAVFGGPDGLRTFKQGKETSDGGFIFTGHHKLNGISYPYLVKTDANGVLEWENLGDTTVGSNTGALVIGNMVDVIQTQNGEYIAVGDGISQTGIVFKYDANGNRVWNIVNPPETNNNKGFCRGVLEVTNGEYAVSGTYGTTLGGDRDGYLTKVDDAGNILWANRIGTPGHSEAENFFNIKRTIDGGFIIAGIDYILSDYAYYLWLVKTDVNGNQEWEQHYTGNGWGSVNLGTRTGVSVEATSDGGYIVNGVSYINQATEVGRPLFVVKTDSLGVQQWTENIGIVGNDLWFGKPVIEAHDGGYMVLGSSTGYGSSRDIYLVKLDQNGQQEWYRTYGGNADDRPFSIDRTSDGGYIIAAQTTSYMVTGGAYAIKIDSLGSIGSPCGPPTVINQQICLGDAFTVGQNTYTQTGTYTDTIVTLHGCDSIVITQLTVSSQINTTVNRQICTGDVYNIGSNSYTASGTYTDTLTSNFGCDSVVVTNLGVVNQITSTYSPVICSGDSLVIGQSVYYNSGTYTNTLVSSFGCDSIVTVNLTVLPEYSFTNDVIICEGETYEVGGVIYRDPGIHYSNLQSINGCDSIIITNLRVIPADTSFSVSICPGQSYTFGNNAYTMAGVYNQTLIDTNGCSTEYTIEIIVQPPVIQNPQTICQGDSLVVGNSVYYVAGTYVDSLTSSIGCDSTVITQLTVEPHVDTTFSVQFCPGEFIDMSGYRPSGVWQYFYIGQEGTYNISRVSQYGCDSLITVHASYYPTYDVNIEAVICDGDSFSVGTGTYSAPGYYVNTLSTVNGCDSIVRTNLTVLSANTDTSIFSSICNGGSYILGSNTYTETGVYQYDFSTNGGCNTNVTLHLDVFGGDTVLYANICDGDAFTVGTSTYTQEGIYHDTISVGGCDSIITTHLTIGYGTDSLGNPLVRITGTVYENSGGGCLYDGSDNPLSNWIVEAESGGNTIYATTDNAGRYSFIVPYGTYTITAQTPANWTHCGSPSQVVTTDSSTCIVEADIGMVPDYDCALLDIDLSIICLVPCSTSTYHLNYHNIGTHTAYNPTLVFAAGPYLTVNWSSVPWETPQSGNLYEFQLDSVPAGASGWIAITVTVDCDPGLIGYSVCSGGIHNASQCCDVYDLYGGAQVELEAYCVNNDSVEFRIKNTGLGDMAGDLDYFILQDDIVYATDLFNLNSQETDTIRLDANGFTYRLEAEQEPTHPYLPAPAITVEGCGGAVQGMVSLGYSDILENGDQIPSIDFDCTEITEDCSCNRMYGSPLGVDVQHYITSDEQLEYTVRFQNQGSDTTTVIVIEDTLPEELDPMTIVKGESSHAFEFTVEDRGVVRWELSDISLPPGAVGTMENAGFVKFTVNLKPGLLKGTVVRNTAHIYFDNEHVATNEVFHTIGERFVDFLIPLSIGDIGDPGHTLRVFPNPFNESTTLEIQGVEARQVYIEIYDIEGRMVQRDVATDQQVVRIFRKGMADGVYTYKVIADDEFIGTGKLIVGGK